MPKGRGYRPDRGAAVTTGQGSRDSAPLLADPGRHLRRLEICAPKLGIGTVFIAHGSRSASFPRDRAFGLSRAIHPPTAVPNLYAGIAAGREQAVCTDLRLSIGRARDKLGCRDMVCGIQEVAAVTWHGAPMVRAASPRQAAHFTHAHGVIPPRRAFLRGKSSQFERRLAPLLPCAGAFACNRSIVSRTWRHGAAVDRRVRFNSRRVQF